MNETASVFPQRRRDRGGGADLHSDVWMAALIVACIGWLVGGCSDERTPPSKSADRSHMQQYDLWSQVSSSGDTISAQFVVDRELADVETPALLTIVTYAETAADSSLLRYDEVQDSLAWLADALDRYETTLFRLDQNLETLDEIDSLWLLYPDSMVHAFDSASCDTHVTICGDTIYCDSLSWVIYPDSMVRAFDTTGLGECRVYIYDRIQTYEDSTSWAEDEQERLYPEFLALALQLGNIYTLALWMDDDTTTRYPGAVYISSELELGGQFIYGVPTDSVTGMKARGFSIDLKRFESCDPINLGESLEVNWVTCFPGSPRPCLSPGQHTLWARLNGVSTKITGTLVLVYAEEGP